MVAVVSVLVGGGTYLLCFRCHPDRRGIIAQGAFRSNQVFVGLPIVIYAFGEAGVQAVAVLIGFTVILYNFLGAVLLILPQQDQSARAGQVWGRTALKVVRNPLILACVAGILYSLSGWPLPLALDRGLELMGRTAAPLVLMTAPNAVVGYVMARELGGDVKLAGAIVVGSTLLSVLTITCWLLWLGPEV